MSKELTKDEQVTNLKRRLSALRKAFVERGKPRKRGEVTSGVTKKMKTGCGNIYITINKDEEGRPFEVFTQIGKGGGCASSQCEAMGRMVSLALRSGIEAQEIINQTRGIACHLPVGLGAAKVSSCSDAMAQVMEWYLGLERNTESVPTIAPKTAAVDRDTVTVGPEVFRRGACPDCGGTVEHTDGCEVCRYCGYNECG